MAPESLRGRYLEHFERMQARDRTWLPGWNFAAFLHSTAWFWYRRMYAWSLLNLIAPVALLILLVLAVQRFAPGEEFGVPLAVTGLVYLLTVCVLVPLYADSLYLFALRRRGIAPKPPSAVTAVGALLLVVIPAFMVYAVVTAQLNYDRRARIAEGLSIASSLKAPVAEFYLEHRKLPETLEAPRFRNAEPMKHTASVGWDPARRAIVVVTGERLDGKRFEIAALEKDGTLEWICRPIDLEPQYLPASCRG